MNNYGYYAYGGNMMNSSGYINPYLINTGANNPVTQVGDNQFDLMMRHGMSSGLNVQSNGGSNGGYTNPMGGAQAGNGANNNYLGPLQGRVVSCKEEVIASMIPMDGSDYYFIDKSNGRIYTKTFTMDGRSVIRTYNLDRSDEPKTNTTEQKTGSLDLSEYVKREDYDKLSIQVNELKSNLQQLVMTLTSATPSSASQPSPTNSYNSSGYVPTQGAGGYAVDQRLVDQDNKGNKKR